MTADRETFARPQKFSLEKRLRLDSFGVHSAQGEFRGRDSIRRISERITSGKRKWHDSQEMIELKDGGVELRLKLSSLQEIERWVLVAGNAIVLFTGTRGDGQEIRRENSKIAGVI